MVQFLLKHSLKTEDSCCVPLFPLIAGCYKMLTDKLPSRSRCRSQKFWKGRPFYLLSPIAMSKRGANGGLWVIRCSLNRNRWFIFDSDLITPSLHERNTSTTQLILWTHLTLHILWSHTSLASQTLHQDATCHAKHGSYLTAGARDTGLTQTSTAGVPQPGVHAPPGVHLPIRRGTFKVINRRAKYICT